MAAEKEWDTYICIFIRKTYKTGVAFFYWKEGKIDEREDKDERRTTRGHDGVVVAGATATAAVAAAAVRAAQRLSR